ncbi:MAG: HAD family hydrolase [Dehalococcoidia bacterium]|nr:HAD family hydrolase [Dehalococcoidia bacterium]
MKAVFLDRDGVINENRPDHVRTWEEFRFLPRAAEAIAQLNMAGYLVFVVTNQAIVNRGQVSRTQVEGINDRMVEEIGKRGGRITEVLYCPHRPEELCECRKPNPGLLYRAAAKYSLDLRQSYLVGDAVSDVAAGLRAGCRNFLVFTGRGWRQFLTSTARRHHGYRLARNLEDAVRAILKEGRNQERERKNLRRVLPGALTARRFLEQHRLGDWPRRRSKCVDPAAGETLTGG